MEGDLTVTGTWEQRSADDEGGSWELEASSEETGQTWVVRSRSLGEAVAAVARIVDIELSPREADQVAQRLLAGT